MSVAIAFSVSGAVAGQFGISDMRTCSFKNGKQGRYPYSIFIYANVTIVWGILISIWKELKTNMTSLMCNYVMVIVSVSLTISIALTMEFLERQKNHEGDFRDVGIIFGSMSGTCIALARLSNRALWNRIFFRIRNRNSQQISDRMVSLVDMEDLDSEEITFLGELFNSITKKVMKIQINYQILSLLFLRFEEPLSQGFIRNRKLKHNDYKFDGSCVEKVADPEYGSIKYQKGRVYIEYLTKKVLREYMPKQFEIIRQICNVPAKDIQKY